MEKSSVRATEVRLTVGEVIHRYDTLIDWCILDEDPDRVWTISHDPAHGGWYGTVVAFDKNDTITGHRSLDDDEVRYLAEFATSKQ